MKRFLPAVLAAAIAAAGSIAATGASAGHSTRDGELRGLLAGFVVRSHAPGGVLLVQTPGGTWLHSTGAARLARSYAQPPGVRVPMRVTGRFRVASVTKTFTAALVLRLVADGKLGLGDTVERWLPGRVPSGAGTRITIRDLLGHRSGLREPDTARQTIVVIGSPGPFYYSNINYMLLAEIVAAAGGGSYSEQLAARIFRPLGLNRSAFAPAPLGSTGLVHGYSPGRPAGSELRLDLASLSDDSPDGSVGIVSDARDLARFERALFAGRVVPRELVELMQTPGSLAGYDAVGYSAYGLGLMRFPTKCGDAWGHRGRAFGYQAYMLSTAAGTRTVVALLNTGLIPWKTVAKLDRLVERALCT